MLEKYEAIEKNKKEILKYIEILNSKKILPQKDELICITKLILFIKSIFIINNKNTKYYNNYMIYNILMLMHSITKDSKIQFFQLYRSLIENILRVMLNLNDNDELGINKLFSKFAKKYKTSEIGVNFTDFIESEYSISCNYVHSNIKADIDVHLFYNEILNSDEMNEENIIKLMFKIKTLLLKFVKFIINVDIETIENAYYRKYTELEYLIGEILFLDFKKLKRKFEG